MKNIYLDNAATTTMRLELLDKLKEIYEKTYANPSSIHTLGRNSRAILEEARLMVAKNLNVKSQDVIFTSGATESNNLAIRGVVRAKGKSKEIICSSIEHSSIISLMNELENEGYKVKYIKALKNGKIDLEHLKTLINENTGLVTVMAVNNETGVIQDIDKVYNLIKGKDIHFHVDTVQFIGKKIFNPYEMGIDSMSLSAHKFYGPKGVGILYIKDNIELKPDIYGGSQERNKRAGTENLNSIILASYALDYLIKNIEKENNHISKLMNYLTENLEKMENIIIHGEDRVNSIINIAIKGKNSQILMPKLDMMGIYVSAGSACMSGSIIKSRVLANMGIEDNEIMSSLRISLGIYNKMEDIEALIEALKNI